MEDKYLVESESDDDESSDLEIEKIKSSVGTEGWQLQDIVQVSFKFRITYLPHRFNQNFS
jgi:hypothetical protein